MAAAGLRALSSLACNEQMAPSSLHQSVVIGERGLDCILQMMQLHEKNQPVQEHGCWTIATLARKNSSLTLQAGDRVWGRLRTAMHTFHASAPLQEKALMAISFLAKASHTNSELLAAEGAIQHCPWAA